MPSSIQSQRSSSSSKTNKHTCNRNTTTTNRKKSVSFNRRVRVKETLHLNNYTDAEIDACWLSKQESMHIRQDIANTLRQHHQHNGGVSYSDIRGLECRTKQGSEQRRRDRNESISAVLDEQDLQDHEGSCCPDIISYVYTEASRSAQIRANVRAILDYQVVNYREHVAHKQAQLEMGARTSTTEGTHSVPITAIDASRQVQSVVLKTNPRQRQMVPHNVAGTAA
uniref:Uncharacterized protein n=1 Tax=Craspedostauros australis TaxID=1486917 RepID=A0A7R9ZMR6_9STRA